jgi:hypothetical protein
MYQIDINTGSNYAIGGDAYNYEKAVEGRATEAVPPGIRIVP